MEETVEVAASQVEPEATVTAEASKAAATAAAAPAAARRRGQQRQRRGAAAAGTAAAATAEQQRQGQQQQRRRSSSGGTGRPAVDNAKATSWGKQAGHITKWPRKRQVGQLRGQGSRPGESRDEGGRALRLEGKFWDENYYETSKMPRNLDQEG